MAISLSLKETCIICKNAGEKLVEADFRGKSQIEEVKWKKRINRLFLGFPKNGSVHLDLEELESPFW